MDRKTAVLVSLGFEIVGIVIFAIYAGGYFDTKYALNGMGTAGAVVLGFIGWLVHIVVAIRQLDKASDSNDTGPK